MNPPQPATASSTPGTTRSKAAPNRRGRPRADEREDRRRRVLDAALAEVIDKGYDKVTMLGIAKRAGSSKETLYAWFDNRDGLFAALIADNADGAAARVKEALAGVADPSDTLTGFGTGLLLMLTGEGSVALNRAAMSNPELAALLLASGRHRVGPLVETYLAELDAADVVHIPDPAEAFTVLYGLIIRDTQIRVLLGEPPPTPAEAARCAQLAVKRFLELHPKR